MSLGLVRWHCSKVALALASRNRARQGLGRAAFKAGQGSPRGIPFGYGICARPGGESTLFWVDRWMDGKCIRQMRRRFTRRSPGASIQERWPERCRTAGREMSLGLSRSW